MCTTEIWTYSECGCRYYHDIPCQPVNNEAEGSACSNPSPFGRSTERLIVNTYTSKSYSSPSHSPSEGKTWRGKQFNKYSAACGSPKKRIIHRNFLEPICDDCVLDEIHKQHVSYSRDSTNYTTTNNGHVILESDVKIEVRTDSAQHSNEAQTLETFGSGPEIVIDECSDNNTPIQSPANPDSKTTLSEGNVDDASPESVPRGRPRSRTKQLRRRGIDLSRSSLRISSRLPSAEKRSLESFRDMLQGRATPPGKNIMQKLAQAQSNGKIWAKNKVADLARSLSRNRGVGGSAECLTKRRLAGDKNFLPAPEPAVRILKALVDLEDVAINASTWKSMHAVTINNSDNSMASSTGLSDNQSSWEQHLQQDLLAHECSRKQLHSPILKTRKYSSTSVSESRPCSPNERDRTTHTCQSTRSHDLNNPVSQPTRSSESTSISTTSPTRSSSASMAPQFERMSSIISDADENESKDENPTALDGVDVGTDGVAEADITTIDESEDSNSSSSISSSFVCSTSLEKRNLDNENQAHEQSPLSIHPLQTPISGFKPNILRAGPSRSPEQTRHVHLKHLVSPWQNTPTSLRNNLPSTTHLVCIWERHICFCGTLIRDAETVRSCVCDSIATTTNEKNGSEQRGSEMFQRETCRAEQPIVRYVHHDVPLRLPVGCSASSYDESLWSVCESCRPKFA